MKPPSDKKSIITLYKEGPAILEKALSNVSDMDLDKSPTKGGWTIRQIVHHIADGDDLWTTGIKQALGNEHSIFTLDWYLAFSQDTWANNWAYAQRPLEASLALLRATREHVLQLIEYVPDAWTCAVEFRDKNGEIEKVPVGFVVDMQAKHLVHHVRLIKQL
jgi:uncharacterized damage-inducible protein DinB